MDEEKIPVVNSATVRRNKETGYYVQAICSYVQRAGFECQATPTVTGYAIQIVHQGGFEKSDLKKQIEEKFGHVLVYRGHCGHRIFTVQYLLLDTLVTNASTAGCWLSVAMIIVLALFALVVTKIVYDITDF